MEKLTLGIYARQSVEKDSKWSIEDQIKLGIQKAGQLNMDYAAYTDHGVSAAANNIDNRPEFQRLFKDIGNKKVHAVFVIDESRLQRNPLVGLQIIALFTEFNILVYSELEGIINYSDSSNVLLSGIKSLMNQDFVLKTKAKVKSVLRNRALSGKSFAGMGAYGYKSGENKEMIVDEEQAEVVKFIYELSASGIGTGTIAKKLNAKGIPTSYKQKIKGDTYKVKNRITGVYTIKNKSEVIWVGNTVLGILRNPIYKGLRRYNQEDFINCPAIVTTELWEEVQLNLGKNKKLTGDVKHQYLLRGLCRCGRCGRNFVGRTRDNKKDHYYQCSSKIGGLIKCGIRSINIDYLDELIWHKVINSNIITQHALKEVEKLKNPVELANINNNINALEIQLKEAKNVKERTLDLYKNGYISSMEDVHKEMKPAELKIQTAVKEINKLKGSLVNYEKFKNQIDDYTLFQNELSSLSTTVDFDFKHLWIRNYIENITINYDDNEEVFTIDLLIKLNNDTAFIHGAKNELHQFYLKKGEQPNILNYDVTKDKWYKEGKVTVCNELNKILPPQFRESYR